MIKLKILHKDGSEYWTAGFNNLVDCNAWLEEEKTRPYWNPDFVIELEGEDNQEFDAEAFMAHAEQVRAKLESAKEKLKQIGLTDDEIQAMIGV